MRRGLALLAVFVTTILLCPLANAATVAGQFKWVERDWSWHTSLGDAYTYSAGDSVARYRGTGIQASDEQKDTTKAIPWSDWALPPSFSNNAASDTLAILIVDVYPVGTSPTVTADTVDVSIQVSDDNGSTWTTCAWTGPRISPDVATMNASAWLETGTSNSFHILIEQTMGGATLGGPLESTNAAQGTPLAYNTFGYQLFRLIVRGDHTGQYRIKLRGWQYNDGS